MVISKGTIGTGPGEGVDMVPMVVVIVRSLINADAGSMMCE